MSQPIILTPRALLALVLILAAVSAAIAVGVGGLTQPDKADAASAKAAALSQGDRAIVSQLRTLNRSITSMKSDLSSVERSVARSRFLGLRGDLNSYFGTSGNISRLLRNICLSTGGSSCY